MFDKFITPEASVIKKAINLLSPKELEAATNKVLNVLTAKGMLFMNHSHLESKEDIDFDGNVTTIPEVHSFFVGKGFLNVASNGAVYHKNNGKTLTIARIESGEVHFNDKGKELVPEILKFQKEKVQTIEAGK